MHRSDAKKAHKSAGEIVRVRGLLKVSAPVTACRPGLWTGLELALHLRQSEAASSEPTGSATPSTDADSVIDTHTQHRLAHSTGGAESEVVGLFSPAGAAFDVRRAWLEDEKGVN
eukprot:743168-Pelagomonas_calceolata.AAC.1